MGSEFLVVAELKRQDESNLKVGSGGGVEIKEKVRGNISQGTFEMLRVVLGFWSILDLEV